MTQLSFASGRLAVADRRVIHRGRPQLAAALLSELAACDEIAAADLDLDLGTCVVRWHDAAISVGHAATAFVTALSAARASEAAGDAPMIAHGARRLLFLAAGGGCLVMTIVGAILPGVPTVPFLLASSYYLARSSRRLHAGLVATPVFGGIVREWESHHAISRSSKMKLAGLTLAVVLTTATLSRATPTVVAILFVVVSTTMVGIFKMPEIDRPSGGRRLGGGLASEKLIHLVPCGA